MAQPSAEKIKQILQAAMRARSDPPVSAVICTAPGHIDVLGGLAVEAGGTVAQMTVPRRAAVAAHLQPDPILTIHLDRSAAGAAATAHDRPAEISFRLDQWFRDGKLIPAREIVAAIAPDNRWAAPAVAAWYVLAQAGRLANRSTGPAPSPEEGAAGLSPGSSRSRETLEFSGATLAFHSQLAPGAGLGSSTALVAAAMQAMNQASGGFIDAEELALYVGRAENLLPDGFGHAVDALTVLHALDQPRPHVLRLSAQPHNLAGQIRLPADVRIMAIDTAIRSSARAASLQNLRVAGAMGLRIVETIYRDLGQRHTPLRGYLANISPSLYRQYFRAMVPRRVRGADFLRSFGPIPERAGTVDPQHIYRVRTTVDHLISENEHAENFLQALEELALHEQRLGPRLAPIERERTLRRAGRLMLASHHSYRLRLEQSCPQADWLVDTLMNDGPARGVYGARISGWGAGGTVVALLKRGSKADDALLALMTPYAQLNSAPLTLMEAGTHGGAGLLVSA